MGKYLDLLYEHDELDELNEKTSDAGCADRSGRNQDNVIFRKIRLFRTLQEIERRCPESVPHSAWKAALEDGRRFLHEWGGQAEELGWTDRDLLGLPEPPPKPSWRYNRVARKDCLGLIWLLNGRRVVALTERSASIKGTSGAVTRYYRMKTAQHAPADLTGDGG